MAGNLMPADAQPYSALSTVVDGVDVVRLTDESNGTTVSIATKVGNIAYEFIVNGKNAYWFPFDSVAEFAAEPKMAGNPLLAPWANRLNEDGFYANDTKYLLNPTLKNFGRDPAGQPIHGLLRFSPAWEVIDLTADTDGASVTSQLRFSEFPALMAQFPFAHTIEMTYRLSGNSLETRTRITNQSADSMPLSIGYHPYFQLHDAPRDDWRVHIAADSLWELNDKLTPTGKKSLTTDEFPGADDLKLEGVMLDNVFGDLQRDGEGVAHFSVQGKSEKLIVSYGPKYSTAVVYAPTGRGQKFICFEPMSSITNAFNLAHSGRYDGLQTIAPGADWEESFSVTVSGF
jgi:aldose 1-epimerase